MSTYKAPKKPTVIYKNVYNQVKRAIYVMPSKDKDAVLVREGGTLKLVHKLDILEYA